METSRMQTIATRHLLYSQKGEEEKKALTIRIEIPYLVTEGVAKDTFACVIEFEGLPQKDITTHGADSLQALAFAVDIDPILRGLSRKYDFFFCDTEEPYFD